MRVMCKEKRFGIALKVNSISSITTKSITNYYTFGIQHSLTHYAHMYYILHIHTSTLQTHTHTQHKRTHTMTYACIKYTHCKINGTTAIVVVVVVCLFVFRIYIRINMKFSSSLTLRVHNISKICMVFSRFHLTQTKNEIK